MGEKSCRQGELVWAEGLWASLRVLWWEHPGKDPPELF